MVIGTITSSEECVKHSRDKETFLEWCDSLVPEEFSHIKSIVDNQRYYCCLLLRRSSVSWDKKKEIINPIMLKLRVIGFTDSVLEIKYIYNLLNVKKLEEYNARQC